MHIEQQLHSATGNNASPAETRKKDEGRIQQNGRTITVTMTSVTPVLPFIQHPHTKYHIPHIAPMPHSLTTPPLCVMISVVETHCPLLLRDHPRSLCQLLPRLYYACRLPLLRCASYYCHCRS